MEETIEPIFHTDDYSEKGLTERGENKLNPKTTIGGVICCQGCYRIGYKSGREFAIEEFENMIDDKINYYDKPELSLWELKKQLQELKNKNNIYPQVICGSNAIKGSVVNSLTSLIPADKKIRRKLNGK